MRGRLALTILPLAAACSPAAEPQALAVSGMTFEVPFTAGSAELPPGLPIDVPLAANGDLVSITGYAADPVLAQRRAEAVAEALRAANVRWGAIDIQPPAQAPPGSASPDRVDVEIRKPGQAL